MIMQPSISQFQTAVFVVRDNCEKIDTGIVGLAPRHVGHNEREK